MVNILKSACCFILIAMMTACASPGVVQLSGNTYVVSKSSAAGAFASMAKLRADTIREANQFAASKGKVAVVISDRETVPTHGFPSYEYQFKLVDKGSKGATDATLEARAGKVTKHISEINVSKTVTRNGTEDEDLYRELMKLDDLRQRGILSAAEFQRQKDKLLSK